MLQSLSTESVIQRARDSLAPIICLCLLNVVLAGQGTALSGTDTDRFQVTMGGRGADEGSCLIAISDGYVAAGTITGKNGDRHIWLLKVDNTGKETWSRQYSFGRYSSGEGVVAAADGGFIVVGASLASEPANYDLRLVKTDSRGNQEWTRSFGGRGWDWGNHIAADPGGGYIITGWTDSFGSGEGDLWLIKIDDEGELVWNRTHGGIAHEQGNCAQATPDGGYIITGASATYAVGEFDIWLLKTDSQGEVEWKRSFGGAAHDEGHYVVNCSDRGYLVLGSTSSQGAGATDVLLIKLTQSGSVDWTRVFGGRDWDWGSAVLETSDHGFLIAGTTLSQGAGQSDIWLLRTDLTGEREWERTMGGSDLDFGRSLASAPDGGFVILGKTHSFGAGQSDLWLIRTNSEGRH